MRTAVIKHRVADFLRQHAPFDCLELEDLLTLADTGRVSFHQANESICRAGNPRKPFVNVVQQGRVDLYEEGSGRLRDILTAGDTIGLECLLPGTHYLHTARTASDVILYGLDSETFEKVASRYPQISRFLAAHFAARRPDRAAAVPARDIPGSPLSWTSLVLPADDISDGDPVWMAAEASLGEVISALGSSGASLAMTDAGSLTLADAAVALATGHLSLADPVKSILKPLAFTDPSTTNGDLFLLLIRSKGDAVVIEGAGKKLVVTTDSLSRATLYNPAAALKSIQRARRPEQFSRLRASTDAVTSAANTGPEAIVWAGLYTSERNRAIIENLLPAGDVGVLWFGADARSERFGSTLPILGLVLLRNNRLHELQNQLLACGFKSDTGTVEEGGARSLPEWKDFYHSLIEDPIGQDIYLKRHYLDLGLAAGEPAFLDELRGSIAENLRQNPEFVVILANDALGKLPPLTFYRNVVVDIEGGSSADLDLHKVALTPLIDSARALALSSIDLDHVSTIERLRHSSSQFPDARQACQDAIEAFRFVAYQATSKGAVIDPAALTKYERELLKSAFRSIAALLKFVSVQAGFGED